MKNLKFFATTTLSIFTCCYPVFSADTGSCGTDCLYNYDPTTQTITYTGTGKDGSGIISKSNQYYELSGPIKNIIVEEGITDIKYGNTPRETFNTVGDGTGKMVLPSTLKTMGAGTGYDLKFATVEINSKNLHVGPNEAFGLTAKNTKLVISSDTQISGSFYSWNSQHPGNLSISCKGNPESCNKNIGEIVQYFNDKGSKISYDYYKEYDSNNKIVLAYHDTGYYKYDSDGNIVERWNLDSTEQYDNNGKLKATYDGKGNQIGSYKYDAGGNLIKAYEKGKIIYAKKYYTPYEAASAVKDSRNNTVSITW